MRARPWEVALVVCTITLLSLAPARAADQRPVGLNEVGCSATTAWIEIVNHGTAAVSLAGWLLTSDPLAQDPPRDDHRLLFASDVTIAPGTYLVVAQSDGSLPFGLTCGEDTVSLVDATGALVDAAAAPVPPKATLTYGRIPDGAGTWQTTVATPGAANAIPTDGSTTDPAWLYDPLQLTEIDLAATPAALADLAAAPTEYVEARITLRHGGTTYGPYAVGLKLKGHASFRTLDGKAAFKVKFAFNVAKQRFFGLKGLTLNNMVQDPSMLAEASSSLLMQALGVPTARVGYAYVRLNEAGYGLYADVETVDTVMMARWFTGLQHLYEGNYDSDLTPDRLSTFDVQEGSADDISDLEALTAADGAGQDGWWERIQAVADLTEMTRAWAAEHMIDNWDSYSVAAGPYVPNNFYLYGDPSGRFSLVPSGTDQTWRDRAQFGQVGDGLLFRHCVADASCRQLYVDALTAFSSSPAITALADEATAIRARIAPWRTLDPRREQSVAAGETVADAKIASMRARPVELAGWLAVPSFFAAEPHSSGGGGGGGGGGATDLAVTGTVEPASAPVGGSHVWRLQVRNTGDMSATAVGLDVQLSPNVVVAFSQATRGSGCVPSGTGLRCDLDWLGGSAEPSATGEVVIVTSGIAPGVVSLTAVASSAQRDPTPDDDTLVLTASTVATATLTPPVARPVLGRPTVVPAKPRAGHALAFTLPVTRSDTHKPLATARLVCTPSVAGKAIKHVSSFKAGKIRLSLVVPGTATGKQLAISVSVTTAGGQAVRHVYRYTIG